MESCYYGDYYYMKDRAAEVGVYFPHLCRSTDCLDVQCMDITDIWVGCQFVDVKVRNKL